MTVPAHDSRLTLHLITHVDAHPPREGDPHYRLFEQARTRMKKLGLLRCAINSPMCAGPVELHHSHVEYSLIPMVDPARIEQAFGLHFADDEQFAAWVESPGNLEPLCVNHHRGGLGVHVMPGPLWEALRYLRAGSPPPAQRPWQFPVNNPAD
ncbi:MAG TPA: hypothetical protein VF054_06590 [Micromonosporaceae bacterium]